MEHTHNNIIPLLNSLNSLLQTQHDSFQQQQQHKTNNTQESLIDSYNLKHSILKQQLTLLTQLQQHIFEQSETLFFQLKDNLLLLSDNQEQTIESWSQLEFLDSVNPPLL